MFCPVCGNQVENNTKFCGNCGNKFEAEPVLAQAPEQDEADAIASFLNEMDNLGKREDVAPASEEPVFNDNTDFVHQNTENRLFLDDDDEEDAVSDEAIVSQFFDNLDTLDTDETMKLTSEYKAEENNTRKIAPVFEEIPDEVVLPDPEPEIANTSVSFIDDDDYSDIVMGDEKPIAPPPMPPKPPVEPIPEEPTTEKIPEIEPVVEELKSVEEPTEEPVVVPPVELESCEIEEEPHILIDERPDLEQLVPENNIGDYNVNVNSPDASYTPYLDSFVSKPNFNVDFETPAEPIFAQPMENSVTPEGASHQPEVSAVPIFNDAPTFQEPPVQIPQQQSFAPPMQQNMVTPPVQPETVPMQEQPVQNFTQPKKKKNTGLIITLSIVGVLLIGIVVSGIMLKDTIMGWFDETPSIEVPVVTDPSTNDTESNETTTPSKPEDTKPTTPEKIDHNPNWEIKENSGLDMPLITGDATLVSKYLDDTRTYENLQVKLSNIVRGDDALAIAQEYEGQTTVRFEKPADGVEYVVVEYQVYVPFDLNTNSTTTNLPIEVRGLNTNGVVYNNVSYIISTWCIADGENSSAGSLVTCREIFQMPVGCNNYYIVFGTQGQTTAVFKGE